MESTRQKKVSRLLQKELASIFHKEAHALIGNTMVSVTIVRVSPDLANANVFLSIFPEGSFSFRELIFFPFLTTS